MSKIMLYYIFVLQIQFNFMNQIQNGQPRDHLMQRQQPSTPQKQTSIVGLSSHGSKNRNYVIPQTQLQIRDSVLKQQGRLLNSSIATQKAASNYMAQRKSQQRLAAVNPSVELSRSASNLYLKDAKPDAGRKYKLARPYTTQSAARKKNLSNSSYAARKQSALQQLTMNFQQRGIDNDTTAKKRYTQTRPLSRYLKDSKKYLNSDTMSHLILNKINQHQNLLVQEQIYAKKLENIRKILSSQNYLPDSSNLGIDGLDNSESPQAVAPSDVTVQSNLDSRLGRLKKLQNKTSEVQYASELPVFHQDDIIDIPHSSAEVKTIEQYRNLSRHSKINSRDHSRTGTKHKLSKKGSLKSRSKSSGKSGGSPQQKRKLMNIQSAHSSNRKAAPMVAPQKGRLLSSHNLKNKAFKTQNTANLSDKNINNDYSPHPIQNEETFPDAALDRLQSAKSIGSNIMNNLNERDLERANHDSGTWDSKEKFVEGAPHAANSPKKMISFKSNERLRTSSKHSGKSSGKQRYRGESNDYQDEGRLNQTTKLARSSLRATSPDFNATTKTPQLRTPKKDSLTPLNQSKISRKESSRKATGRKSSKKDKQESGRYRKQHSQKSPSKAVSNMQAQITDLENQGMIKAVARNSPSKRNEQQSKKSLESLGQKLDDIDGQIEDIKERVSQLDRGQNSSRMSSTIQNDLVGNNRLMSASKKKSRIQSGKKSTSGGRPTSALSKASKKSKTDKEKNLSANKKQPSVSSKKISVQHKKKPGKSRKGSNNKENQNARDGRGGDIIMNLQLSPQSDNMKSPKIAQADIDMLSQRFDESFDDARADRSINDQSKRTIQSVNWKQMRKEARLSPPTEYVFSEKFKKNRRLSFSNLGELDDVEIEPPAVLLNQFMIDQHKAEVRENFPKLRTNFKQLSGHDLIEYVNEAYDFQEKFKGQATYKMKIGFDDCKFRVAKMHDLSIQNFDMLEDEQRAKQEHVRDLNQKVMDKIDFCATIRFADKDPDGKLFLNPKSNLEEDKTHVEFMSQYQELEDKKKMVFVENFREHTKQWKMAYDPYASEKMLQVYGKEPPQSFKIRQKILLEQRNILDRYSHPAPVHDPGTVLDAIKKHFRNSRRDYLAEKEYLRYKKDKTDVANIFQELKEDDYKLDLPKYLSYSDKGSQYAPSELDSVSQQIPVRLVEKEDDVETTFAKIKESYNLKSGQVKPVEDHHEIDLAVIEQKYFEFIRSGMAEIEELDQSLVIEGNDYCNTERIKKQMVIKKRLDEIRPIMEEHNVIGHLQETFDQSDYFIRMQRNQSFWKSVEHPGLTAETLWNNYYRSFGKTFLGWLTKRDGAALRIPCPERRTRKVYGPLHYNIFNRDYFTLEKQEQYFYNFHANRTRNMAVATVDAMFQKMHPCLSQTSHAVLKETDVRLRKLAYYPEHFDYNKLQAFISHPKEVKLLDITILGMKNRLIRNLNWLLNRPGSDKTFSQQQFVQKDTKHEAARCQLHFLDIDFERGDNGLKIYPKFETGNYYSWGGKALQKSGLQEERPLKKKEEIAKVFNQACYKTSYALDTDEGNECHPITEQLEVIYPIRGSFNENKYYQRACHDLVMERLNKQEKEINELYEKRAPAKEKKMKIYKDKVEQARREFYRNQRAKKMIRARSEKDIYKNHKLPGIVISKDPQMRDIQEAYIGQLLPLTEDYLHEFKDGKRLKERIFEGYLEDVWTWGKFDEPVKKENEKSITKRRSISSSSGSDDLKKIESIAGIVKPSMAKCETDYLEGLREQFEAFKKIEEPVLVKGDADLRVPLPSRMGEFMQIREYQEVEEESEILHFSPVRKKKAPIVVTEESDDDDSALSVKENDPQSIYQQYFNQQLRRELKKAILEGNETLVKNYLKSLAETNSHHILNIQEKKNLGNTLLHIIVRQVQKSAPPLEVEIDDFGINLYQQCDDLVDSVNLLLTYPEPSYSLDPTIKNDLGFTALDYVERIKRDKDRNLLKEMLQTFAKNDDNQQIDVDKVDPEEQQQKE